MEKALAIQKNYILATEIYNSVKEILGESELFLIGGAVRDIEMGNTPKDWDFTGPLHPDVVIDRVKKSGRRPYITGARFGTVGWKTPVRGGFEYIEYTVYRSEQYDGKTRKPSVVFYSENGDEQ